MDSQKSRYNCCVPNCSVNKKLRPELGFFRLPKNSEKAKQWLQLICLSDPTHEVIICEEHFNKNHITANATGKRLLSRNAIPALKLPLSETDLSPKLTKVTYNENLIKNNGKKVDCLLETEEKAENLANSTNTTKKRQIDENPNSTDFPVEKRNCSSQNEDVQVSPESAAFKTSEAEKTIDGNANQLIDIQKIMQHMQASTQARLQLSMKLYFEFPRAYKILQNVLCVPPVAELKNLFKESSLSLEKDALFHKFLREKVFRATTATGQTKQCFVSLVEIEIKPRVFYDIDNDHLLGIYDFDKTLKSEPATTAIVMIVQGLFDEWQQPVDVCYVNKSTTIDTWVHENIGMLMKIGYSVRAIVSDFRSVYFQKDTIVMSKYTKIYCINDISLLFRIFYYNFIKYDYTLNGVMAQRQHIEDYYKIDSKKKMPLTPKLTEAHINPPNFQDLDIKTVMEVFSSATAAAMSTYIDFKILEQSAKNTVLLITKMNMLYNILNAGRFIEDNVNSTGFDGKASDLEFLYNMISLLETITFVDNGREVKVPEGIMNIHKIKMAVRTILLLSEELKRDNYEHFPFWRLNFSAAESFRDKVKKHNKSITKPSAKAVDSIFRQLAIIHFLKPYSKTVSPIDLNSLVSAYKIIAKNFRVTNDKHSGTNIYRLAKTKRCKEIVINKADYETIDLDRNDAILFLAGFLLKKCTEAHDCSAFKEYNCVTLNDAKTVSMCESLKDDVRKNVCVIPRIEFIELVEAMEILFKTFLNKEKLETTNRKIVFSILSSMDVLNVPMPCKCFPELYYKTLFVRFRLYHTIKYNNDLFKTKRHKSFVVNNLY